MKTWVLRTALAAALGVITVTPGLSATLDFTSWPRPPCPGYVAYPSTPIQGVTLTSGPLSIADACLIYDGTCGTNCPFGTLLTNICGITGRVEASAYDITASFDPSLGVTHVSVDGLVSDLASMGVFLYDAANNPLGQAIFVNSNDGGYPYPAWPFSLSAEATGQTAYAVVRVVESHVACAGGCTCDSFVLYHLSYAAGTTPTGATSWGRLKIRYR